MKCTTTYTPIVNAALWTVVYFLTILSFVIGAVIVYDLVFGNFEWIINIFVFGAVGLSLLLFWIVWRRGLFLNSDFVELMRRQGGEVTEESGVMRAQLDGLIIDARFGQYLRGGAPFPSWHSSNTRGRPCGDPECMLCDTTLKIRRIPEADGGGRSVREVEEIVGGTWEGLALKKRLERALLEFDVEGSREPVSV